MATKTGSLSFADLFAMLNAEEMGISSKNVDEKAAKPSTLDMAHTCWAQKAILARDSKLITSGRTTSLNRWATTLRSFERNVDRKAR